MGVEKDRAFHLERAAQCHRMAEEASDPAVKKLHEQLAEFHEAEARRGGVSGMAANEDAI